MLRTCEIQGSDTNVLDPTTCKCNPDYLGVTRGAHNRNLQVVIMCVDYK